MSHRPRSWLFGPATRLDFVAKFDASDADVGILDLEDSVAPSERERTRRGIAEGQTLLAKRRLTLLVRVNAVGSVDFEADVAAAGKAGVDGIVVPKLRTPTDVGLTRSAMDDAGLGHGILVGGLETAAGLLAVGPICAAGLDYVYFGAEDYVSDLGGRRSLDNAEVHVARSMVVMAATAAGVSAIDQVVVDISDLERVEREATEAKNLGYVGKLCIHPSQVAVINKAFGPSAEELAWASGLLDAFDQAAKQGLGVAVYQGSMIDAPLVAQARRILDSR